mgnify:CR=1 FL=1
MENADKLKRFRTYLDKERYTSTEYNEMLRKIANLMHRIGGMEDKT